MMSTRIGFDFKIEISTEFTRINKLFCSWTTKFKKLQKWKQYIFIRGFLRCTSEINEKKSNLIYVSIEEEIIISFCLMCALNNTCSTANSSCDEELFGLIVFVRLRQRVSGTRVEESSLVTGTINTCVWSAAAALRSVLDVPRTGVLPAASSHFQPNCYHF